MRPIVLYPVFSQLTALDGIGFKTYAFYKKLCGETIKDLIFHLPVNAIDRSKKVSLSNAEENKIHTLSVKVLGHNKPAKTSRPYVIAATDGTDTMNITYFSTSRDYLPELYPVGAEIVISGLLEKYNGQWTMLHPDYAVPKNKENEIPMHEPVYPLSYGLTGKMVRKSIEKALVRVPELPEWIDEHLMKQKGWSSWKDALVNAHTPTEFCETDKDRRRLAYDELLADQLGLAIIRTHNKTLNGRKFVTSGDAVERLKKSLLFSLTESQETAVNEIISELESDKRMSRLLQGDVGSGKTIVALIAMLHVADSGSQAALMAPTEILAKQHFETLSKFLEPIGYEIGLITGKGKSNNRQETIEDIKTGKLRMVIGTHALFQSDIVFDDLGLAVIDEQHKFGVQQRVQLSNKGKGVNILSMTATPIPRTLLLTAFGDMAVSRLSEKPKGRQKIETSLMNSSRIAEIAEALKRKIQDGSQVYWVCPLIEESEALDLNAAKDRAGYLKNIFGKDVVGLVYGKMKSEEKDSIMSDFVSGKIKILVATTVIEVGVNVPNATLMVVEHAERFGLAQLHQLRGRVGRGEKKSHCILIYQAPLGIMGKARLKMMKENEDGFLIAEEDLRLRGAGEVLGTRQSGARYFRLADLERDKDLLDIANSDAKNILAQDPKLESERGKALKMLLYLFEKDATVPLIRS
ncbi:MAG: ATP-dependent DNA helicase RecG [Alphaproteobacteria bacterium]|nr:ATP-dependent DNA helicase RecG [Alphaproteobacteria bacterium]MCL2504914.1 ATP-dependent DNA helicase RecG [Alphaproteobacteria bacterium]